SALALWQANYVRDALRKAHPHLDVQLRSIRTTGDENVESPGANSPLQGMFTKQIQQALLEGIVDLAVHSLKDLPIEMVDGLAMPAVTVRADPADALVSKANLRFEELTAGAKVLAGSPRRRALVLHLRGDLTVMGVRGNVGTRLAKLDAGDADCIVLAKAGLERLGLAGRITQRLDPTVFVPACGQAALALEVRAGDRRAGDLAVVLDHLPTRRVVTAERAFLAALGGGCQLPAGAYARSDDGGVTLTVVAVVADVDGSRLVRHSVQSSAGEEVEPEELGRRLAREMCEMGGREIIEGFGQAATGGDMEVNL
ncbi:MAG: hydroxymethylbilane synthase, partial [Planctomycetes bacterium]|nr:hydroxymethylbilane synthase [Planctomycetota bacterium]